MKTNSSRTHSKNICDVSRYGNFIRSFGSLSKGDELALISLYKETKDREIADEIVNYYLKIPFSLANRKYFWVDIPTEDLIQEGNISLIKSLETFDPTLGRFSQYAYFKADKAITEYIRRYNSLFAFSSTNDRKKIEINYSKYCDLAKMASDLDVLRSDIIEYQIYKQNEFIDVSERYKDEEDLTWADIIPDESSSRIDLYRLIDFPFRNSLTDRERKIILDRWINDSKTFEELSIELGVSIERVRQIEKRAFDKIREHLIKEGNDPLELLGLK